MNSKTLFSDLVERIVLDESPEEKKQLVLMAMQHTLSIAPNQILMGIDFDFKSEKKTEVDDIINRLNRHEPIQYIIGKADFYGRSFMVNPSALIPRPETEELVSLICKLKPERALDIGTGSGCIAITLKLEIPESEIFATDISDDAISVAIQNANHLGAKVGFIKHDILNEELSFRQLDLIVSNPPYIPFREKKTMSPNVLEFEPHLALFVSNEDPLIYYKAIADKSKQALAPCGRVVVEISEHYGKGVVDLFSVSGYSEVSIHKDINGKDRIVSARIFST